ncbi:hypothetical protein NHX12_017320, partial [Muraenolepis orangiensis]
MTEGAGHARTIPRVGLRCTIRFQGRTAEERLTARTGFCKGVILGQLGLTVENVRCIQWNQQEKAFDVTLMDINVFNRVAETCEKEAGPPFFRRCRRVGHRESDCAGGRCRRCGEGGHEAKDCLIPKACNGCGELGHLYRSCPSRRRTFAEAAGSTGGLEPVGGPSTSGGARAGTGASGSVAVVEQEERGEP